MPPTDGPPEHDAAGAEGRPSGSRHPVIRPYEPRDLDATLRLRPLAYPGWKEASLAEWHVAVYDWLARNPAAPDLRRWVIDDDGEIVGHLAAVPLWYRIGGERVLAHTPADYMALPGHGFHAVGLMRTFFRTCESYVSCNPVGDASKIEGLFKTSLVADLVQVVKMLDVSRYPRLPRRVPRVVAAIAGRGLALLDRVLLASGGRLRVEAASDFDPSFDAFFERVAEAVPCIPEKGTSFLRWRYGPGTPRGPLTTLVVRARDGLLGYAVLRTTEHGEGFILDLMTLPGRRDVARALLREAVRRFWRDRAFVIRYRFLPSGVSASVADLRRLGFLAAGRGRGALPGAQPERQLQLHVRLADPGAQALAVREENWSYNLGDGEASFWVH